MIHSTLLCHKSFSYEYQYINFVFLIVIYEDKLGQSGDMILSSHITVYIISCHLLQDQLISGCHMEALAIFSSIQKKSTGMMRW